MDERARRPLFLIRGEGRGSGPNPRRAGLRRGALRVIPGGLTGDAGRAIGETSEAARELRREIEERIARALEELF